MKNPLSQYLIRQPYILPIISAILLILTFPPFNFWYLIFIALVPFYFFLIRESRVLKIFIGGAILGLIFSGYIAYLTIYGFTWIPEAHLFSGLVKFLSIPVVALISAMVGLASIITKLLMMRASAIERPFTSVIFALNDWLLCKILVGFNYGSLVYAASHFAPIRGATAIGGTILVAFIVVFGNNAIAEVIIFLTQKINGVTTKRNKIEFLYSFAPLAIWVIIIASLFLYTYSTRESKLDIKKNVTIAVIQNNERNGKEAFGKTENGIFDFKLLENRINEANINHPNIIIYPFSPWSGVIADTMNNSSFDREVIATDFKSFGKWIKPKIPAETTFVVWVTALRDGEYWNELEFWRNGELIGSYQKRKLFAFMDYTPKWSQKIGMFSTPFDATAGTSTETISIDGNKIGGLVCSEVTNSIIAKENTAGADLLLAIGSESMFTGPLAGEFNLLNAQLRATETGVPVIRANKFGPSAIIDGNGNIIEKLKYNQNGILFGNISLKKQLNKVHYEPLIEHVLLFLFAAYGILLWKRK